MTRDELRGLVQEADIDWHKNWNDDGSNRLEHLAALIAARVAAAEREACAEVCDAIFKKNEEEHDWLWAAWNCAAAIRARGKA
jgi:hypothetical protein